MLPLLMNTSRYCTRSERGKKRQNQTDAPGNKIQNMVSKLLIFRLFQVASQIKWTKQITPFICLLRTSFLPLVFPSRYWNFKYTTRKFSTKWRMLRILKWDYITKLTLTLKKRICRFEQGWDRFQTHTKFSRKIWKDENTSKTWA
jgi:hypothetical protein